MSRAWLWAVFGLSALAILGTVWVVEHYERVPTTRWEGPGKAALRDPYLALERYLERMGRPLQRVGNALSLDALPPGGALLLDRARRIHLNPRRADQVLDWVARGGYLIVAAEAPSVDDPILKRLGVVWRRPPEPDEPAAEGEAGQCPAPPAPEASTPDTLVVRWPGGERPLALDIGDWAGEPGLWPGESAPLWTAEPVPGKSGAVLLHYAHGQGQITVLSDLSFFNNWRIGDYDHAELLWTLLRQYAPAGPVRLAARLKVPTLWEWLADSAWMALVSGGLWITAWLWAIVPRFGGVVPVAEPERRGLGGHLAAVGRAVWREGGLGHWVEVLRQEVKELTLRRHPHLAALPEAGRIEALARIGGVPPERVAEFLNPTAAEAPEDYTRLTQTAQRLIQRL